MVPQKKNHTLSSRTYLKPIIIRTRENIIVMTVRKNMARIPSFLRKLNCTFQSSQMGIRSTVGSQLPASFWNLIIAFTYDIRCEVATELNAIGSENSFSCGWGRAVFLSLLVGSNKRSLGEMPYAPGLPKL